MLYAGLDCSTQSLTVIVIDAVARDVVFRESVPFDEPFISHTDPAIVHADPRMWAAALEAVLGRLPRHVDVSRLSAISGSAQQHGSVYCGETPEELTRATAPIWMDSSTARECEEIEMALGGPAAVAWLTGSRAYPRFTGPQIRKFARESPDAYAQTRRIHLVSSYMASLLVQHHAPMDHADASGMNLMDIRNREWSPSALDATAPALRAKLGDLVPSPTDVGPLAARWQRLGLPAARVIAWTGDNPSSLVGTGVVREGQLTISLGTSDTVFGPMEEPRVSADGTGHVFASPLGGYMGITVFRNGSLARDRVRRSLGLTWDGFADAMRATSPGNLGGVMLPWFEPEITPFVPIATPLRVGLDDPPSPRDPRAIVEAQALAMRRHSAWMRVTPDVIHATGGASTNAAVLQVLADVFNARVVQFDAPDAAALGAAMRACQAHSKESWDSIVGGFIRTHRTIEPDPRAVDVYRKLGAVYARLESTALAR